MNIRMMVTLVRPEEKSLLTALTAEGFNVEMVNERALWAQVGQGVACGRVDRTPVLLRGLSHHRSLFWSEWLDAEGVEVINRPEVIRIWRHKALTSLALHRAGVPQPGLVMATDREEILRRAGELNFPLVVKSPVGSWGRLMGRVDDVWALEALLEHKEALGPEHQPFYLQEWVDKPSRDLRVFMAFGQPLAGIERHSAHWITNTARGGTVRCRELDADLVSLCRRAAEAVGGGLLAVDILEDPQRGYLVGEINHTMEFRNSSGPTGVDIPREMARGLRRFLDGRAVPCSA